MTCKTTWGTTRRASGDVTNETDGIEVKARTK